MVVANAPHRLPGLQFTTLAGQLDEVLPRMDVAVFIGFTASGPLNVPVVVEDVSQFLAVFGDDVPLAWDDERREQVYAHLAPGVRAFFRNGGVRCWVIRVAGSTAVRNTFPVSGLINLVGNDARPAWVYARAAGSWADALEVAGGLLTRPMAFLSVDLAGLRFQVDASLARGLVAGDLLRLEFPSDGYTLLVTIATLQARAGGSFDIVGTRGIWLSTNVPGGAAVSGAVARVLGIDSATDSAPIAVLNPVTSWATSDPTVSAVNLALTLDGAPVQGALLQVNVGRERLLLVADDIAPLPGAGSPRGDAVRVSGTAAWWLAAPPPSLPRWGGANPNLAEVLTLELSARYGTADPVRLGDLGFQPEHPGAWWSVPTDEELYGATGGQTGTSVSPLWQAVSTPRYPLAGPGSASVRPGTTTIPLGLPFMATRFNRAVAAPGLPLERDGLASFSAALFGDPNTSTGMHAAARLDEATLIAIPDAVHRPWQQRSVGLPLPPQAMPPADIPAWGTFLAADTRVLPTPLLTSDAPDDSGTFTLSWLAAAPTGATFVLQEARTPDFSDAFELHAGPEVRRLVYGRSPGAYYYRVRMLAGRNSSDWSIGVTVQIAPPSQWLVSSSAAYDSAELVKIQRALVSLCAARGDVLAVLSLPSHYHAEDARAHVATLRGALGNARVLSFGAVYHPWALAREESSAVSPIRRTPPDGPLCGMMARRAIDRGAWIAPANTPLQGIVALEPALGAGTLFDSGVNAILRRVRGFLPGDADTLTDDPDLRPINVRRLLILIRRLALRHGTAYVFEPHGDALRRRVQHQFEALLDVLLARGAFAGTESRSAYRVRVDATQATTGLGESGQLVVELAVAPALPTRFITVRLVQTGGRTFAVEVS